MIFEVVDRMEVRTNVISSPCHKWDHHHRRRIVAFREFWWVMNEREWGLYPLYEVNHFIGNLIDRKQRK